MGEQGLWDDVPLGYDAQRQRAFFATAPAAMVEITAEGRVSWANTRWCELIAPPSNGALESYWFDAVHPDDLTRVLETWRKASDERTRLTIECRVVVPERGCRWIEFRAAPLIDPLAETAT